MGRHQAGNRAALGGMTAVMGPFLVFLEGPLCIVGVLLLLGRLVVITLAFLRSNR